MTWWSFICQVCQVNTESLRRSHNPRCSWRPPGDPIDAMVKNVRHGHKLRIKGHRGWLLMRKLHELAPSHAKEPGKESVSTLSSTAKRLKRGEHGTSKPERKTVHHPQQAFWAFATTTIIHVVQATQRQTTGRICSCTEHGKSQANQMHNATQHSAQHSQCPCLNLLDPTLRGGFFHE